MEGVVLSMVDGGGCAVVFLGSPSLLLLLLLVLLWLGQHNMQQAAKVLAKDELTTDDPWVRGELTFVVDDPGRQAIGSFNPVTEGDWRAGAVRWMLLSHLPLQLHAKPCARVHGCSVGACSLLCIVVVVVGGGGSVSLYVCVCECACVFHVDLTRVMVYGGGGGVW